MKNSIGFIFLGFSVVMFGMIAHSCKHGCIRPGGTSRQNDDESHNMGLNCINCHSGTGTGEGCFVIGGTVYDLTRTNTVGSCIIELYTEPEAKGELIFSLASDRNGNFYTGQEVFFSKGLYATVKSPDGKTHMMLEPITHGACNSCHGNTTDRIWVN